MAREQPSVAYLGPRSSFTSHVASGSFCESEFFLTPKATIPDVFTAVQSGAVDRGVVPFENSWNGPVLNALDLLADRLHQYPDIHIAGEVHLRVNQCLLGQIQDHGHPSPPVTPTDRGTSQHFESASPDSFDHLNHIEHIYSHPQAFGQCESFLSKYLPKATHHEVSSTAAAAHVAAQDRNKVSAAIGSATAAQQGLGLTVLAHSIQDAEDNETRFLVLKRFTPTWHYEPSWMEEPPRKRQYGKHEKQDDDKRKMLVSFSVQHSCPGALADALAIFKKYRLNLTSISARPSRKQAWHYRHFVEFEWRSPDEEGRECPVDGALRELSGLTRDWRCHGAWGSRLEW